MKPPPVTTEPSAPPASNSKGKTVSSAPVKRDAKKSLKGVLVKKKAKAADTKSGTDAKTKVESKPKAGSAAGKSPSTDDVEARPAKKRKVDQ